VANNPEPARKLTLTTEEIHSISMTSNGKICTNFWNQSTVNFYDTHQLVQQTTSTLEDCLLSKIDIAGYAPFMALDVD